MPRIQTRLHAEYVAETVRQLMYAQYGDSTYTRGLKVYTTLVAADQAAAYRALRKGIMDFERRQIYRGPEKFVDLPADPKEIDEAVDDALAEHPDNGDVMSAVVLKSNAKEINAVRGNGDTLQIVGEGLRPAQSGLSDKAPPNIKIRRGAVIRVVKTPKNTWEITQLPEVEGAFIALDPRDGAVKAMVGGFDFDKNKFNHVTQAWRQPGSSFKPFIYSAALEKGFTPGTVVNDAPLFFDAGTTGGQPWEPKNYDGNFEGPMSLRRALAKSKNMVSIRILQSIGTRYAQDWISNFGFEREKHPAYLPMALGAGSVTPMQMATAYSVFANGGYRVNPYLVTRITDHKDKVLVETQPPLLNETMRAIPAAQRLHHGQPAAGSGAQRHGRQGASHAEASRPLWQDRHDQRLAGRVVRRLPAHDGRSRMDGLRHAAQARRSRNRRRPEPADLDQLHGDRHQGRAGHRVDRHGAVRRGQCRRRVVLRRLCTGPRRRQPGCGVRADAAARRPSRACPSARRRRRKNATASSISSATDRQPAANSKGWPAWALASRDRLPKNSSPVLVSTHARPSCR